MAVAKNYCMTPKLWDFSVSYYCLNIFFAHWRTVWTSSLNPGVINIYFQLIMRSEYKLYEHGMFDNNNNTFSFFLCTGEKGSCTNGDCDGSSQLSGDGGRTSLHQVHSASVRPSVWPTGRVCVSVYPVFWPISRVDINCQLSTQLHVTNTALPPSTSV